MQISKKQKNALIRELDSFARAGRPTSKLQALPKPKQRKQKNRQGGSNLGSSKMVSAGTGIHVVQDSSVPLSATFSGSESLGSVNGSSAFTETQFPINPGQAVTFPRLSQEAKLWDLFEFEELAFEFRTSINQFATNAFGRVTVGVDYDAGDPAPSTLSQAEISRPVAAGLPYDSIVLRLRKSDMNGWMKRHFVRPGNLPGSADIKMFDIGVLNFGTSGNVNSNVIGELWVHFRGRFYNQVLESTATAPKNYSMSMFSSVGNEASTSTVPHTMLFATAAANGLGAVNTTGSILLPAGNYLVGYSVVSADTSQDLSELVADLQTNVDSAGFASVYAVGNVPTLLGGGSTTWFDAQLTGSVYLTLDGSTPLKVLVTPTFSGGTNTLGGNLTILAV